jgi:hypothetical protein
MHMSRADLELMRVPGDEDIHIQLPLQHCQRLHIPPRNNLKESSKVGISNLASQHRGMSTTSARSGGAPDL